MSAPLSGPREMHQLRLALADYFGDYTPQDIDADPDLAQVQGLRAAYATLGAALNTGSLFYVSRDMCDLVHQAARSLESWDVEPSDIPTASGLVWFEEPIERYAGRAPIHLVAFRATEDGCSFVTFVSASWYEEIMEDYRWSLANEAELADDIRRDFEILIASWDDAISGGGTPPPYVHLHSGDVTFGQRFWTPGMPESADLIQARESVDLIRSRMMSTFLLMQQELTTTSEAHADRSTARRAKRANLQLDPVRVIALRRPSSAPAEDTSAGREWTHRWVVRGHWRRQPYGPGRTQRRPVWIAPHMKGPEDAPVLGGEKIYTLKR